MLLSLTWTEIHKKKLKFTKKNENLLLHVIFSHKILLISRWPGRAVWLSNGSISFKRTYAVISESQNRRDMIEFRQTYL